jgi:hypothetical protein
MPKYNTLYHKGTGMSKYNTLYYKGTCMSKYNILYYEGTHKLPYMRVCLLPQSNLGVAHTFQCPTLNIDLTTKIDATYY